MPFNAFRGNKITVVVSVIRLDVEERERAVCFTFIAFILSCWCHCLFFMVPFVGLWPVSVSFPGHTYYLIKWRHNWDAICDFQQCGFLTSVDSDEPVQPSFKPRISKCCSVNSLTNSHRLFKQLSKGLIRLRFCSGWSETLLVTHSTNLLEISCCGSIKASTRAIASSSFHPLT